MAKLWILSDLHLETLPYPDNFRPAPPAFDVLVAAGDIQEGDPGCGFAVLRRLAGDRPYTAALEPRWPPGLRRMTAPCPRWS